VQLKDILKEKFTKGVLFSHFNAPALRALENPEEAGLPGLPVS